ncbi:MAG TPA: hypothetical protein GXX36_03400 [Clostridiaceae bacterium]|nr:hypothetical protein [Clostridiaceae bacterium]
MSFALFAFLQNKLKKLQLATEKRLSPLEEQFHALTQANINMEPTVLESTFTDIASLPKNAANGPFGKFVLKGNTRLNVVENILKGGNFHDMSAWEILNIDPLQIYPYSGILTINFTGEEYYFYMAQTLAPKPGHRYYVQGEIQCVNCGIEITAGSQFRGVYDNQQYELISMISDSPTTLTFSISGFYDINPKAYLRNWMVIDLGDSSSPLYNKTEEELKEIFTEYFDGTYAYRENVVEHAQGSYRIRRVGKNIFGGEFAEKEIIKTVTPTYAYRTVVDERNVIAIVGHSSYLNKPFLEGYFKPNTRYTFQLAYKRSIASSNGGYLVIRFTDGSTYGLSTVIQNTSWHNIIYTTPAGKSIKCLELTYGNTTATSYIDIDTLQVEEGTTATEYEPYTEQSVYVNCGELRRLPNGVCDEYDVLSGIKTQRVSDEWRLWEYDWQYNDLGDTSNFWMMQLLTYPKTPNYIINNADSFYTINYPNNRYILNSQFNVLDDYAICFRADGRIFIKIPKSEISGAIDNTKAKAWLQSKGTKLIYQLAEQIITKYYPQTLTSKPSGTIYCEPVLGDADFYGQGITLEGFTFTSIDKVTKVDLESGIEIDVTNTCTLNEAKNGFTSSSLQAGDICWYELRIDPETTLIPEMEYAYYDSRYVVIDDSNGKYYKWKIASTNGTPRIELEEV